MQTMTKRARGQFFKTDFEPKGKVPDYKKVCAYTKSLRLSKFIPI
jgi:hypothetical protein